MKILKYILIIVVVLVGALALYLKLALPNVGEAPDIKVDMSADKVARGEYLANRVCVCMDCHSTRDWSRFSGPLTEGTLGKGGECFDEKLGFPGVYFSRNITPAALKDWTDGEIYRAITSGVSKDGRALFPVMPYAYYGKMASDDIYCIIAYLRSLPPIENTPPASHSNFPMNFIVNTIPRKAEPQAIPPKTDAVAYGHYVATSAGCVECHSPVDKGQIIQELAFSGGREFAFPNGNVLRSTNISPELETGIGAWSEDQFVQLFRLRSDSAAEHQMVKPDDFNTIMPWTMYGKMNEEDLRAIYVYLRSVKPIKNNIEKFTKKS